MKTTMPLPLELTRPVALGASSLEESLKAAVEVEKAKYNPQTQVRENPEGIPQFFDHHGTSSKQNCQSFDALTGVAIDVTVDIQIDDNEL